MVDIQGSAVNGVSWFPPDCYSKACELVFAIARRLTQPADRLAVFATACCHEDWAQVGIAGCQLHPLGKPSMRILRKELTTLIEAARKHAVGSSYTQTSHQHRLSQALSSILDLITDGEKGQHRRRHHFVVASFACCDVSIEEADGTLDHVNLAGLGLDEDALPKVEGYHSLSLIRDLANRLVENARLKLQVRPLRDIVIDYKPGPSTSICNSIGPKTIGYLPLRSHLTLLVEVETARHDRSRQSRGTPDFGMTDSATALTQAWDELEFLLGETIQPVLTIRLSFMNEDSTSQLRCIRTDILCNIRRSNAASVWNAKKQHQNHAEFDKPRVLERSQLYKLVASQLLSTTSSQEANASLRRIHDSIPATSYSQLDLISDDLLKLLHAQAANATAGWHSTETTNFQLRRQIESTRNADLHDNKAELPEPEVRDPAESSSASQVSSVQEDEAREIWRLMRKDSKSHQWPQFAGTCHCQLDTAQDRANVEK